jgi:hypothetical protein
VPPPELDVYREIVRGTESARPRGRRWVKALVGIGASVAGLFFGARQARGRNGPDGRG